MNAAIINRIEAYRPYVVRRCRDSADDVLQDVAVSALQSGLDDARAIATIVRRRVVDHIRSIRGKTGKRGLAQPITAETCEAASYDPRREIQPEVQPDVESLYAAAGDYAPDVREWAAAPHRSLRQSARVRAGLALIRRSVAVQ